MAGILEGKLHGDTHSVSDLVANIHGNVSRILEQIMASIRDKELDLFSPLSVTYVADIGDSFSSLINSQGLKHVVSFDSVDQRSRVLVSFH